MGHLAMTDTLMRELRSRTQGHGRPTWVRPRDFPSTSKSDIGPLTKWRANSAEGIDLQLVKKLPCRVSVWFYRTLVLFIGATPKPMQPTAGGSRLKGWTSCPAT